MNELSNLSEKVGFLGVQNGIGTMLVAIFFAILHRQNNRIERKLMAAIDDLKAADQAETAEIATVGQALTDAIARIGAITVPTGATDAQIAAVNADLASHLADLQTIAASLATIAVAS